jgi:ferredoxin/coenzyme F420-reducing hydrogenase delta subunit
MATGFLLNMALNEVQNNRAYSGFCKRARYRKSNCQRCLEICPENVISLDPGPTIKNGCTNCSLCQNACPTEVFQPELYTDPYLLNQAKTFLDSDRQQRPGEKKKLFAHCQRAQNQDANSLLLPCLGRITPNIILGAALLGFDEVALTRGICSQCRLHAGQKLLLNSITASRILLKSAGLGRFKINIEQSEKKQEALLSRREIFSKISSKAKHTAASFAYYKEKAIREKLAGNRDDKLHKRPAPARQLLRKLLEVKELENDIVVKHNPTFPWAKIKIEEKKCSACGICPALCPTGAISKKLENDKQLLFFNTSLCTNCSLCRAACPQNAIDFEENFCMADILAKEPVVIARIKLTLCLICGEMITARKNKLCSTCRKRQVWPMYLKA